MMQIVRLVAEWVWPVTLFLLSLVAQLFGEVELMVVLLGRRVAKWWLGTAVGSLLNDACTIWFRPDTSHE